MAVILLARKLSRGVVTKRGVMPDLPHAPYSYRANPAVPAFDDGRALFVFDGVCVPCSGGAAFVLRTIGTGG